MVNNWKKKLNYYLDCSTEYTILKQDKNILTYSKFSLNSRKSVKFV